MREPPDIFFRVFTHPVVYVLVLLGFHLFLRGHNTPGGGFIAGLVIAVAALLSRIVMDQPLTTRPAKGLIPLGLLLALGTGVAPMMLGESFLTSAHGHLQLPLVGELELATALFFDTGVFLVVISVTLTIIELLSSDPDAPLSRFKPRDAVADAALGDPPKEP